MIGTAGAAAWDFDTFLSHNSRDKPDVRQLKAILEERGVKVWLDEDQLQPGARWLPLLKKGLERTGSIVVAVGREGSGPWQEEETDAALRAVKKLERPIIPVLLPGAPAPEKALDMFLLARTWVDLRAGWDPAAIDRLIWGISGQRPQVTGSSSVPAAGAWILVAGSGGVTPVPETIQDLSRFLGERLAQNGFSLVTGGWNGVDDFVARAFARRVLQDGGSLSGRLVQVIRKGARPHFSGGRLVSGGSDDDAWHNSVERADGVVLVGGLGGTYRTGEIALRLGKPVFPLADSRDAWGLHADARRFYDDLLERWEESAMAKLIELDDFLALGNPVPEVVSSLLLLLARVIPGRIQASVGSGSNLS